MEGAEYAELDSTGLLYRTDQLQILNAADERKQATDDDSLNAWRKRGSITAVSPSQRRR